MKEDFAIEENRLREAYARRVSKDPRYSWFSPGHVFIVQERERTLLRMLARYGFTVLDEKRILEIGCGSGYWLREFIKWGARPENVFGIDLLAQRVAEAKTLCPPAMNVYCGSATDLLFPDASFDLVVQSTVFTSILDKGVRQQIASEMSRVVKPGGIILWYDYHINNPRNPDVRAVKKTDIYELFPHAVIEFRNVTLIPPLARQLARFSWLACYILEKVPWLCTHYFAVIRRDKNLRP